MDICHRERGKNRGLGHRMRTQYRTGTGKEGGESNLSIPKGECRISEGQGNLDSPLIHPPPDTGLVRDPLKCCCLFGASPTLALPIFSWLPQSKTDWNNQSFLLLKLFPMSSLSLTYYGLNPLVTSLLSSLPCHGCTSNGHHILRGVTGVCGSSRRRRGCGR